MEVEVNLTEPDPYTHEIMMEPTEVPAELVRERIVGMRRVGSHFALGYVVDADSLQPLANVRVIARGTTAQTRTDARGYFELHVPTSKPLGDWEMASLVFEAPGFDTGVQEFRSYSDGDTTFRARLFRKGIKQLVAPVEESVASAPQLAIASSAMTPKATAPANATVRIPRTIRVQITATSAIQYLAMEDYVKHSLPREWISSWGTYTGGSNSLKAGAVADRSYAIAKLQAASTTAKYDICDSTSCQVFGSTTDTRTDAAVDQTAGYVMVSGTTITSTEYSSEDNSLANTCGDGYTEPSTTGPVCIYDPVCSGETRFGHGRGMCQYGTVKWATGLKFAGNGSGGTATNGFPKKDWIWICNHYYPTLDLVHATPLVVGDDVKANITAFTVRGNADGTISNAVASGMNCPQIGTEASGNFGVIIASAVSANPLQVTNDTYGFTWYYVQWNDGLTGWSPENWLQRVIPAPSTPTSIVATAIATNQVNVSWVDTTGAEIGFTLQRA
ncbi:MAG: Cna domain protein, partial [Verrucomicrobiales bacterium]|nr:Cna domain protein [Verrucomicrobiales bacterium]